MPDQCFPLSQRPDIWIQGIDVTVAGIPAAKSCSAGMALTAGTRVAALALKNIGTEMATNKKSSKTTQKGKAAQLRSLKSST